MSKQRPTLDQGPTQSERTRHQSRDVVKEASDDRTVGSCGASYSISSPLKSDAVAQSWCYHCCDGPRSCPSVVGQLHMDAVVV